MADLGMSDDVGFSPISILGALFKIVGQANTVIGNSSEQVVWQKFLEKDWYNNRHRGMLESIREHGELVNNEYLERIPDRIKIIATILKMCGSRDVDKVNKFLEGTGIRLNPMESSSAIYSATRLNVELEWPKQIKSYQIKGERKANESPRFAIVGSKRICFMGQVLESEEYNAVNIEVHLPSQLLPSTMYDLSVIFILPPISLVSEWKAAQDNPVVQREILMKSFLSVRARGRYDPNEAEVYLQNAILPCKSLKFNYSELDEFNRFNLGRGYFIAQTAHVMSMTMDEKGMSVTAGTGMSADKGLDFRPDARGISIDFTKNKDGFLCFVMSTRKGIPDANPEAICLAWLYG